MAKNPQRAAPIGEWELPNQDLLAALGTFVIAWSGIETTVEAGIHKQTGLPPLESSIITAGLMFKSRTAILSSLLNRNPEKNAQALAIVRQIEALSDRNDIVHGIIGGNKTKIWFNRRKTGRKFTSKIEDYDLERLRALALKYADLSGELFKALGLTKDSYLKFLQQAHNDANRA
ncbi:MAG: hypothetical protein GEU87_10095 [Alphaproteobacteria bacterium]|nr:hypothetical protein [Alphaproteobacteria bacterium]